ncbi:MAG: ABC transporter permease [Gemmatimonadaceae bacterium]|nr:ABC transporter permease [Chitinophagaceae bacterium]
MFRNFLKVAIRNILRHKSFSAINIAGLSLGVTACLLIGLFVWDEKQYDDFIPDGDRIYRIYNERVQEGSLTNMAMTPPMFTTVLQKDYPEIEHAVKFLQLQSKSLFEANGKKIYETGGIAGDSGFFKIFPLQLEYGNPGSALSGPTALILSQALAKRFFGTANPIGKSVLIDKQNFQVSGILRETTQNFHLSLNFIINLSATGIPTQRMESWQWQQFNTYVKLKPGTNAAGVQAKFAQYVKTKILPGLATSGTNYTPFFQPLSKIHLYSSDFKYDMAVKGNILYVKALSIIAVFILIIACFNFINLSTAKSLQRAKEVGLRKSIGASRMQLMLQFTGETLLITIFSVLISLALAILLLGNLNEFTGKNISYSIFYNPLFLLTLLGITVLTALLAGFYPAMVLSRFEPVRVLKGNASGDTNPGRTPWLRHSLVVTQFTLSALLIVGAMVVYRQVDFLHNKDLGFKKDQIMFFPMRGDNMTKNYSSFKEQLLRQPGVSNVSMGYGFPGDMVAGDGIIVPQSGGNKEFSATQLLVDHDYVKTLSLQLIAGRDFSRETRTDETEGFIINETAVRELGLETPEKAIGHPLIWTVWESVQPDSLKKGRVIGVVKDFHYKSLYDKVTTAVIQIYPPAYWKVAVKMRAAETDKGIAAIKQVWQSFSPDFPLEYNFLDENFEQMYNAEDKLKTLLSIFTVITISVGCLGLFGLAAYSAQKRKKEIGIRKVLGASVGEVVVLLSKDFVKLILIALVISWPFAWYFMHEWLNDFAYRIDMNWGIFAITGLMSIAIAFATVCFQAIKAAMANPSTSLRSE